MKARTSLAVLLLTVGLVGCGPEVPKAQPVPFTGPTGGGAQVPPATVTPMKLVVVVSNSDKTSSVQYVAQTGQTVEWHIGDPNDKGKYMVVFTDKTVCTSSSPDALLLSYDHPASCQIQKLTKQEGFHIADISNCPQPPSQSTGVSAPAVVPDAASACIMHAVTHCNGCVVQPLPGPGH